MAMVHDGLIRLKDNEPRGSTQKFIITIKRKQCLKIS